MAIPGRDEGPPSSVIVVNYNGGLEVMECLESIVLNTNCPYELIVVDNASTDGSADLIERHFRTVLLIRSEKNQGYSSAVNLALREARGKYIAVLNMDVVVEKGWLLSLVRLLEERPEVGAATPLLLMHEDRSRINALGQTILWSGLGFNRKLGWPRSKADASPHVVSGLQGAAFLVRADILRQLGGMNESCFLYHEDVDLSWLIYLVGYKICTQPEAVVYHRYKLTLYPEKLRILERNRWRLLLCNLSTLTMVALSPYMIFTELLILAYCLFNGIAFLRAKAASIQDVLRTRDLVRTRKAFVRTVRRRSDLSMLGIMHPILVWDQVIGLFLNPSAPKVGWSGKFQGGSGD